MPIAYQLKDYKRPDGTIPLAEWLRTLRDANAKARIWQRLARAERANFGDHKSVGDGVWEMRIDYGAGYRVYYAVYETTIILLFCGGDKRSQSSDIEKAKTYKRDYEARRHER